MFKRNTNDFLVVFSLILITDCSQCYLHMAFVSLDRIVFAENNWWIFKHIAYIGIAILSENWECGLKICTCYRDCKTTENSKF